MNLSPEHGPAGPPYRAVFMGTPEFAVPTLACLLATQHVVGVFTQPDRPAGRGRKMTPSPVKVLAVAHGLPVFQPASLRRDLDAVARLEALAPDVLVVAAYGLILPTRALEIPPGGALNVHASLLPRWRGAAPVHHALLAGDKVTGITIMLIDQGLDTGPILAMAETAIRPEETAGELTARLAVLGAELLVTTLPRWMAGQIEPRAQDEAAATYAPRLERFEGWLDWSRPVEELARRVRALQPWPGTFTEIHGELLKIHRATPAPMPDPGARTATPGTLLASPAGPVVATADGWLRLDLVQPAGKPVMPGTELLRGRPGWIGAQLATPSPEAV